MVRTPGLNLPIRWTSAPSGNGGGAAHSVAERSNGQTITLQRTNRVQFGWSGASSSAQWRALSRWHLKKKSGESIFPTNLHPCQFPHAILSCNPDCATHESADELDCRCRQSTTRNFSATTRRALDFKELWASCDHPLSAKAPVVVMPVVSSSPRLYGTLRVTFSKEEATSGSNHLQVTEAP